MVHVVFADKDRKFCEIICNRLSTENTGLLFSSVYTVSGASSIRNIKRPVEKCEIEDFFETDKTLFVLSSEFYSIMPEDIWKLLLVNEKNSTIRNSVCKYCSVSEMLKSINAYIDENPQLSLVPAFNGMTCVFGIICKNLKNGYINRISEEKTAKGYKSVILDLAPPYATGREDYCDTEYTLTDALLRVIADDLSAKDIGLYLYISSSGELRFRHIEKADDLFECDSLHIQKLIKLIRDWIKISEFSYHVIINCSHIPLSFIHSAAVLCDEFIILQPSENDSASKASEKEISFLLSEIPESCKIIKEYAVCGSYIN